MQIIMGFIYQTLLDMGYKPVWNKTETGLSFRFNMELAICRIDPETLVVTVMVPNVFPVENSECEFNIRQVNARNHIGRLANIDGTSVAAISAFFADSYDNVSLRTRAAVKDLTSLIHDFFESMY